MPTLVVGARHGPVPAGAMRWIADRIPGAVFALFETGHLMFVQEAEAFDRLVGDFLASHALHHGGEA